MLAIIVVLVMLLVYSGNSFDVLIIRYGLLQKLEGDVDCGQNQELYKPFGCKDHAL